MTTPTPAELRALVAKLDNLDRRGGLGYDAHDLLRETVEALPALLDRLAAAERDAERLAWLADNPREASIRIGVDFKPCTFWGVSSASDDLRAAIDAAREGEK